MYQKKPLMLLFCTTFVSPFVMGKTVETTNNQQPTTNNQQPTTNKNILPEIVVYGDNNKSLSSVKTLSSDEISKTPTSNGNITDYLRSNPHIRYENSDQDGFQRGEIKPENISINGADPNQTAYFVDNVNINNELTADSDIFDGSMQVVPGISHTQAYFFDATMLSKVEVQDSNISASLGGFMGGAVIAKTKQYSGTDSIKLKYRTTNSSWAKMEAGDSVQKILKQVRPDIVGVAELQPKYDKQTFNILAEKRLNDNLGMVFGYSRRTSSIEQNRLIGYKTATTEAQLDKQNHQRLSDNLLLNFNWTPQEKERIEFGLRYSNYKELKYFKENINNNVSDYHQALGSTLAWVHSFNSGVWTNTLAYDRFQDKRKSSSNSVETTSVSDENDDPLYNFEKGGYGNSQLIQDNLHFSTEYVMDPFYLASTEHSVSIGGIYQATKYQFYRPQDVHSKIILSTLQNDGTINPFPFPESTTPKGRVKTSYQNIAIYAEDLIKWRKFEFRPGIRIERNDYLKNNNIAPRFVARYRPWDNTGFTLGLNRYYGRSFAPLKLANGILKLNNDPTRQHQNFSSLKSPYADELSLSFDQNMGNLALKLGYIHRDNKNRIILKRGKIVGGIKKNSYINGRPFGVDIYTFQLNNIEPWKLGKTYWTTSLGFDWLNTKRADGEEFDLNKLVSLDGKLMTYHEMLRQVNSNTEDWIARLGIDMTIPDYDITWSNKVYMKAPIRRYDPINENNDDNNAPPRYRSYHYGRHTQWDSSIRWQPTIRGKHSVYLQVDILNVLNKTRKNKVATISTSDEYGVYTPGREFWLEVGYQF